MSEGDPLIKAVEVWLNDNYSNHPSFDYLKPEGSPGNTVVGRLIMALQIELGISNPVPSFGPGTEQAFQNISRDGFPDEEERHNLVYILQGAFWAKGYSPGTFDGKFNSSTESAIHRFQSDVGFDETTGIIDAKLMKALLNTDGFRIAFNGNPIIRTIQRILNTEYAGGYFDYIPTNGIYERQTNRALIYALQIEIGLGNVANGSYGPATIENTPTLHPGNSQTSLNRILQFGLAVNGMWSSIFDDEYSSVVENAVRRFQEFMTLPVTGIADMPTIKQLLTSNGYIERPAVACDASMIINTSTATTLQQNGYEVIGRYLTGTVGGVRSKAMTFDELGLLQSRGIRVFPIYQDGGASPEYFGKEQGINDAREAILATYRLGFPEGTTIYFAVDFDVYDYQISQLIIPYMAAAREVFAANDASLTMPSYQLGVYGPRNVCIRCAEDSSVRTVSSFVANMSTGFSGNLGFPMPENWSFGQFYEMSIGSGSGYLEIDKNDYSGRDAGASVFNPIFDFRDEEELLLLEHWKDFSQFFPTLSDSLFLFSPGFEFNQSYTVIDNPLFRVDVETAVDITLPAEIETITINVVDGQLQGTLGSIFGAGAGFLSTFGITQVEDYIEELSLTIENGFIEFGVEITDNEIRFHMSFFKEEIDGPQGNITLASRVVLALKLNTSNLPFVDQEKLAKIILTGGTIAAVVFLINAKPLVITTASIVALIATVNDYFEIDE